MFCWSWLEWGSNICNKRSLSNADRWFFSPPPFPVRKMRLNEGQQLAQGQRVLWNPFSFCWAGGERRRQSQRQPELSGHTILLISFSVLGKKLSKGTISFIPCSSAPLWPSAPPMFPVRTGTFFPATAQKSLGHGRSTRQDLGIRALGASPCTNGQPGLPSHLASHTHISETEGVKWVLPLHRIDLLVFSLFLLKKGGDENIYHPKSYEPSCNSVRNLVHFPHLFPHASVSVKVARKVSIWFCNVLCFFN